MNYMRKKNSFSPQFKHSPLALLLLGSGTIHVGEVMNTYMILTVELAISHTDKVPWENNRIGWHMYHNILHYYSQDKYLKMPPYIKLMYQQWMAVAPTSLNFRKELPFSWRASLLILGQLRLINNQAKPQGKWCQAPAWISCMWSQQLQTASSQLLFSTARHLQGARSAVIIYQLYSEKFTTITEVHILFCFPEMQGQPLTWG